MGIPTHEYSKCKIRFLPSHWLLYYSIRDGDGATRTLIFVLALPQILRAKPYTKAHLLVNHWSKSHFHTHFYVRANTWLATNRQDNMNLLQSNDFATHACIISHQSVIKKRMYKVRTASGWAVTALKSRHNSTTTTFWAPQLFIYVLPTVPNWSINRKWTLKFNHSHS